VARERASSLPRLLSTNAVSQATTLPQSTTYTFVARGEVPAVRVGRAVRVDERDLLASLPRGGR
jgi:excisionase family DNA binding protein